MRSNRSPGHTVGVASTVVELGDYDVDDAELLMDEAATNGELGIEFIAGKLSTYAMSM